VARTFNAPLQSRTAGTYGPFTIDGRQLGDNGARIELIRATDGIWPGASTTLAARVLWEFDYGSGFQPAGSADYFGGTQVDRWTQGVRLADYCNIYWPKELVGGVLTPVPPNAARVSIILFDTLNIGASTQWL
jgi:hypothetical protein